MAIEQTQSAGSLAHGNAIIMEAKIHTLSFEHSSFSEYNTYNEDYG